MTTFINFQLMAASAAIFVLIFMVLRHKIGVDEYMRCSTALVVSIVIMNVMIQSWIPAAISAFASVSMLHSQKKINREE
ncbi:hypothetical protein [Rhodococcus qingshengii]|uniref:hypothetical protein n=1 Tax=Rhodococcus qingshengii TaxID=334542 RepID=UPI0035D8B4E2